MTRIIPPLVKLVQERPPLGYFLSGFFGLTSVTAMASESGVESSLKMATTVLGVVGATFGAAGAIITFCIQLHKWRQLRNTTP